MAKSAPRAEEGQVPEEILGLAALAHACFCHERPKRKRRRRQSPRAKGGHDIVEGDDEEYEYDDEGDVELYDDRVSCMLDDAATAPLDDSPPAPRRPMRGR